MVAQETIGSMAGVAMMSWMEVMVTTGYSAVLETTF